MAESQHRKRVAAAGRKAKEVPRPNPIERRMTKFLREPPSVRLAASVIVTATAMVVVGGGILIRLLDHHEYPTIWVGMWWAIQTVTTVGYGDVTPEAASGRLVGVFVMLEGIAFLAIVTAVITSTFVARAEREQGRAEADGRAELDARLDELWLKLDRVDEIADRLERVETLLAPREPG